MSQKALGEAQNSASARPASVSFTSCDSFSYAARPRMNPTMVAASAGDAERTEITPAAILR